MAGHGDSKSTIMWALMANFLISIAKTVGAVITGSGSLLAEAIHSFADCGNQLLLLTGLKRSQKLPDKEHPLGYGKAAYFYSFLVAILLFSVGGLFSIYEGTHKLLHPEPMSYPIVAVCILLFSLILEGLALSKAVTEINKIRKKLSMWAWVKQSRQSELIVVGGEDLAAVLGLFFALIAVSLTWITGNPFFDAFGSIVVGTVLIIIAFFIGVEVKSLLIGESASPDLQKAIQSKILEADDIEKIYHMITLQLGHGVMVAVKAKLKQGLSGDQMLAVINNCEKSIRQEFDDVQWIFFEPDNKV